MYIEDSSVGVYINDLLVGIADANVAWFGRKSHR